MAVGLSSVRFSNARDAAVSGFHINILRRIRLLHVPNVKAHAGMLEDEKIN
jgi:hypothetical protein